MYRWVLQLSEEPRKAELPHRAEELYKVESLHLGVKENKAEKWYRLLR